jgi:phasin
MADQTTMASSKASFRVPPEMLSFAEQSVEQAKKAFDSVMTAAKSAASAIEGQTVAAQAGAKDMQRKAVAFAEHNVDVSFDFATRLLAAKDGEEVMQLHADYVKTQMQALGDQARELGQTAARATGSNLKD